MNVSLSSRRVIAGLVCSFYMLCSNSHAQIPVTDLSLISTSVANQVESIAKWAQQFEQMRQQIQQYQQQYAAITGSRGMGQFLDNSALKTNLPPDWAQVLASVKSGSTFIAERSKYPVTAGRPSKNGLFDVMAAQSALMSDLYSKANARLSLVQGLTSQIDLASDPAAKADLSNRLLNEQNAIQANQNFVSMLQANQKLELESAAKLASKESLCKEFKRSTC